MANYEKANVKSGRLFVTDQQKLADNPKLPVLNGTIMVDGVVMYLGLWKRKAKNGGEYFTAELTYPNDEKARLHADGPATSKAAEKEREYDKAHPQTERNAKSQWENRGRKPQPKAEEDDSELPF